MNPWEIVGWAAAALVFVVVLCVAVLLIVGTVGAIRKQKSRSVSIMESEK